MREKNPAAQKEISLRLQHTANSILPFTEKPSIDRKEPKGKERREIGATELFSMFTADIIKEEVIFTR